MSILVQIYAEYCPPPPPPGDYVAHTDLESFMLREKLNFISNPLPAYLFNNHSTFHRKLSFFDWKTTRGRAILEFQEKRCSSHIKFTFSQQVAFACSKNQNSLDAKANSNLKVFGCNLLNKGRIDA